MKSKSRTITKEFESLLPTKRPPTHPGEMLSEEFLKPMSISQSEFARHLGWTHAKVSEIIHGKRGITPQSALAISDALGTTPDLWMQLQQDFDLWHAMRRRHRIKPIKKAA
jgi:addiction module HigA family antidote